MNNALRYLFFAGPVRFLVLLVLGLNVRSREKLPVKGPAIVVANHNSHLDTLTLLSLMPLSSLPKVRPVAALDYFMSSKWLAWFATRIIGILPIERGGGGNPLTRSKAALEQGSVLVLYPEGTRGEPEKLAEFKRGVALLVKDNPGVPVVPVLMHGLGKALPKGTWLLVPFICDIFVGDPIPWKGDTKTFMADLRGAIEALAAEAHFPAWD
ncbi:MAG: 1-acyl-sn-glycerol-3-phosphate acyltransferase [Rhizobiales bacterium]|nr:1-acyl-sn-glycerol-3-phosphate acyltransferase [Hyphomicrobiales bacterium]